MFRLYDDEGPLGELFTDLAKWSTFHYEKLGVPIKISLKGEKEQYLVADIGGKCALKIRESRDNSEDLYGLYVDAERPQGAFFMGLGLGAFVSTGYFILDLCCAGLFAWNLRGTEGEKSPRALYPSEYKNYWLGAKKLAEQFPEMNDPIVDLKRMNLETLIKKYRA